MAEEIDCANLGLPADFFTEDFFAEKKSCEGGGNPYDWVWNTHTGPDAGEDHFAELTCKMAHYFPLDDEGDRMPSTKVLLVNASSPLSSLLFLRLGALTWVVLSPSSTSLAKRRRESPSLSSLPLLTIRKIASPVGVPATLPCFASRRIRLKSPLRDDDTR